VTPLRFGIVGMGRGGFGCAVARHLPEQMRVTALCDAHLDRAQACAERYAIPYSCDDYGVLLGRDDVDAVLIATPDHLHAEMAIQALEAGKHVLSEIPMAYSLDEIHHIVGLTERTGLKYMMGNEVRWLPALEAARTMARDGFWGDIFYGEAEYLHNLRRDGWSEKEADGSYHWRFDPALPQTTLLGGGPHAFDTLRWLVGEEQFVEVFAYGVGRYVPPHPEPHTAVALLKGASGAAYKVTVSYEMVRPYCLYFSLYGSQGSFEGNRIEQSQVLFQSDKIPYMTGMERLAVPYWNHPGVHMEGGHGTSELFMMKDFVAAIRENRAPAIDAREAARSIAPAICALESIQTGKPVAIPVF
jgi:predicted dehydrogenase